jgi:hypothetical protein
MVCRTQTWFKVGFKLWMTRGLIFTCPKAHKKSANRFDQGLKPEPPESMQFFTPVPPQVWVTLHFIKDGVAPQTAV